MKLFHYTGEGGLKLSNMHYIYWRWPPEKWDIRPDDVTVMDMRPLFGHRGATTQDHEAIVHDHGQSLDYLIFNPGSYGPGDYPFIPKLDNIRLVAIGYQGEGCKLLLYNYNIDIVLVSSNHTIKILAELAKGNPYKPVWVDFQENESLDTIDILSKFKFVTHKLSMLVGEASSRDQLVQSYCRLADVVPCAYLGDSNSKVITRYNQYVTEARADSMNTVSFDKFCERKV